MPDGFDPHTELARITTLREVMIGCRALTGKYILNQLEDMLSLPIDDPLLPPSERMRLHEMILNRGYGKPRQHVYVSDGNTAEEKRVKVYLPDNGRSNQIASTAVEIKDGN